MACIFWKHSQMKKIQELNHVSFDESTFLASSRSSSSSEENSYCHSGSSADPDCSIDMANVIEDVADIGILNLGGDNDITEDPNILQNVQQVSDSKDTPIKMEIALEQLSTLRPRRLYSQPVWYGRNKNTSFPIVVTTIESPMLERVISAAL